MATLAGPSGLILIVAASTKNLGIGYKGQLPWPMLKKEMGYFARVTKRVMPSTASPSSTTMDTSNGTDTRRNAVVMGRKTFLSVPPRFRPLASRLNVVITTSPDTLRETIKESGGRAEDVVITSSPPSMAQVAERAQVARVFVIGGATIYDRYLRHEVLGQEVRHILLTRVARSVSEDGPTNPATENGGGEIEADTFFPLDLDGPEAAGQGWKKASREEWASFTGENPETPVMQREGGYEFEFCLYSR